MAGTLSISSTTITGPSGTKQIGPFNLTSGSNTLQVDDFFFTGAIALLVTPPPSTYAIIVPPPTNVAQLTLRGAVTDIGVPLSPNQPTLLPFFNPGAPLPFYLVSASTITGPVEITYI